MRGRDVSLPKLTIKIYPLQSTAQKGVMPPSLEPAMKLSGPDPCTRPTDMFKSVVPAEGAGGSPETQRATDSAAYILNKGSGVLGGVRDGEDKRSAHKEEEEEDSESENENEGGDKMEGIETDDLELSDDLQLLYPEHSSPVQAPPSLSRASLSSSRSAPRSPPVSALSPALFPEAEFAPPAAASTSALFIPASASSQSTQSPTSAAPASTSTSSQLAPQSTFHHLVPPASMFLQLSPRRALAELAAEPNLIARLTQSWGELRAEVAALRAEMRSAMPGSDAALRLEERVRRLEGGQRMASVSSASFQSNVAQSQSWHPLQHLICGDAEMDVDVDAPVPRNSGVATALTGGKARGWQESGEGQIRTMKNAHEDAAEPLPPRSRKFNSVVRLTVV